MVANIASKDLPDDTNSRFCVEHQELEEDRSTEKETGTGTGTDGVLGGEPTNLLCGAPRRPRRTPKIEGSNSQQPARRIELQDWDRRTREHQQGRNQGRSMWSTEAKEWRKLCAEHPGQGGTRKMEGSNSQQPTRNVVKEEKMG
jgi:hypothetical protein